MAITNKSTLVAVVIDMLNAKALIALSSFGVLELAKKSFCLDSILTFLITSFAISFDANDCIFVLFLRPYYLLLQKIQSYFEEKCAMLKQILKKSKFFVRKWFLKHSIVGDNVTIGLSARCDNDGCKENVRIGNHCWIGARFVSRFGGKITIGNNTYIGGNTFLLCKEAIEIGKEVIISNNVYIMDNNNHPTSPSARKQMSLVNDYINDELWSWEYANSAKVTIGDNVWIGRDVRIMKGVTVGKGSIVALGSIVTRDVPEYCVVAGNPARVVKQLESSEEAK